MASHASSPLNSLRFPSAAKSKSIRVHLDVVGTPSIVETDKVIHTMNTDIVKLVVEIESFGMSSDEFDKETGSSDWVAPKLMRI
ncbi:hypothetical protein Tco_0978198 [Tanacetum coccineum]|uniref:Uncharacterized protein n=1 Tax=Tanacetum coccineum TaxID=301880 RepID=A0ABQ5EM72_9ASTR